MKQLKEVSDRDVKEKILGGGTDSEGLQDCLDRLKKEWKK
jgi:hypothetical protein